MVCRLWCEMETDVKQEEVMIKQEITFKDYYNLKEEKNQDEENEVCLKIEEEEVEQVLGENILGIRGQHLQKVVQFKTEVTHEVHIKDESRNEDRSSVSLNTAREPIKCTVCSRTFDLPHYFQIHFRTHTGEKSPSCGVCRKRFANPPALVVHMRDAHNNGHPYKCPHCQKIFVSAPFLEVHIRTHTGQKPFVCSFCQKRFISAQILKQHIGVHTNGKIHMCEICGKYLSSIYSLKKHKNRHVARSTRTHTGEIL